MYVSEIKDISYYPLESVAEIITNIAPFIKGEEFWLI